MTFSGGLRGLRPPATFWQPFRLLTPGLEKNAAMELEPEVHSFNLLCSSHLTPVYQNHQVCNLAFFIFDEAKCLAAISTFGEEIDLTLGQPLPFFAAGTLLRHQLVAFAGYRQYSIWIRLILPDVSIKNRRVNLYGGAGGNQ